MTEQEGETREATAGGMDATREALRMLDLFQSVGAEAFDILHMNLQGGKRGFRPSQTVAQAKESIPYLIPNAARRQNNLIIRPRSKTTTIIQLDDLPAASLPKITAAAFLTLQTSPGSVQAWVAVQDAPIGFAGRLKKGLGADKEASGSVRIAGSRNFKEKYAPAFPVVTILDAKPGHVVTLAQLESLAVLAPPEPVPPPLPFVAAPSGRKTDKWPSYQRCLDNAPKSSSGSPKRTNADFVWCQIAISWGHGIEETAERLMQESTKAKENGQQYAIETAHHAEYAARQRNARPVGRPAKTP